MFSRARALQLFADGFAIAAALALAYGMRFEGIPPRTYVKQFLLVLPYLILLRLGLMILFGVYRLIWRYISLRDLPRIVSAIFSGTVALVIARYSLPFVVQTLGFPLNRALATVPYGVLAAEFLLTSAGLISGRILWRIATERAKLRATSSLISPSGGASRAERERKRALLIGAGSAGVMIAREVAANLDVGFEVVGFVDDDKAKRGTIIQGYRVLGTTEDLADYVRDLKVDVAILAIARAPAASIRRLVRLAESCGINVKIIPGLYEILSGRVNISKVRDVAIEDLLGRKAVQLDEDEIGRFLTAKTVLVTGAGGSIGSEICRQVSRYRPSRLLLLDQAENTIYHILRELKQVTARDDLLLPLIGNVVDRARIAAIMREYRPEVVFHAAAHKHVPLMEVNPGEAIRNNVQGSRNVAELAHESGAQAFVMISTDKAVNPTSVMGATKRLAEIYVQSLAKQSQTRFTTVRFGNVLGSEGSVVPLFKEQIARGGPLTVTHPEMKRYFMTIPEASQLVLQAATMGQGGEIFILEMGDPIAIVNLARDLIRLSGYRPGEDIQIVFTGIRPGEKLHEEMNLGEERATKTQHPRIWIGSHQVGDPIALRERVDDLVSRVSNADSAELRQALGRCVPEYRSMNETDRGLHEGLSGSSAPDSESGSSEGRRYTLQPLRSS